MTVSRITGVSSAAPAVDIEEQSHFNPNPSTREKIWDPHPGLADADPTRFGQAGLRSRTTLSGARLRAQLASAMSGLTNARFAGEPSLEAVLQGSALPRRGEGVKRVQQALMDLGFTVRGGADGIYGLNTRSAVQRFQREQGLAVTGQVDAATLSMLDRVSPPPGATAKLQNARFADDPRLQQILLGATPLNRADSLDTVKRVQQALQDMGYNAPLYGVDGKLGGEAARLIKSFQRAQGLPITGQVDRATLRELDRLAPAPGQQLEKYPEYDRLFADGFLTTTFALGYDEDSWHVTEGSELRSDLAKDGYRQLDPTNAADSDLLTRAGYDVANLPSGVTFYNRPFDYQDRTIQSVVQLITPDTPDAVKDYEQALVKSDVAVYMGHARYGTGPDFDPKESTAGNYVIGVNSALHKAGKLTPGYDEHMNEILKDSPNNLEQTQFDKDRYQLWAFYACKTINYDDELRALPKGKDEKNLDIIGSNDLLYWNNMAASGMTTLLALTNGESINSIQSRLYDIHQIQNGFYTDGFGDNP